MTVWKVLGAIVLLALAVGLVRVGGMAEYSAQGIHVYIRLGAFHIHVFPFKKKRNAKKKKGKRGEKKREPERERSAGGQEAVQEQGAVPSREAVQEQGAVPSREAVQEQGAVPSREAAREPERTQRAEQERKRPPKNERERKKTGKEASGPGGPVELLRQYLPLVSEAGGALLRRIRIDTLFLDYTAGGSDPAQAAMSFGLAHMAAGIILPVLERGFDIKERRFRAGVNFEADKPAVYLKAAFSARIGQVFSFAVIFGVKFLRAYLRGRKAARARKG